MAEPDVAEPDVAEPGRRVPGGESPRAERPILVLGSASPARATLLRNAGVRPVIRTSTVDEDALLRTFQTTDPRWITQALARAKALDVAARLRPLGRRADASTAAELRGRRVLVVGADSMLALDEPVLGSRVLGKARSADEVRARWAVMAGGTGTLVTGHTVVELATGRRAEATAATLVRFGRPRAEELEAYIASGEPLAVAGSCTIDGLGGPFIDGIDGDHTNVIGLALPTLRGLLQELGVRWTDLWEVA